MYKDCIGKAASFLPGHKVFDIACGTGWVTIPAAKANGKNGHIAEGKPLFTDHGLWCDVPVHFSVAKK